jgi:uncharacterized protein YndB with AHSA1/START domain
MPDILQDFPIRADAARVFEAVSTSDGLNRWWTKTCRGEPGRGGVYALGFGPEFQWTATVSQHEPSALFELTLTRADADWAGTRVGFELSALPGGTQVRFYHRGWPAENEHYRTSCHCWALYLRVLRRYLEHGETVAYADRLDA